MDTSSPAREEPHMSEFVHRWHHNGTVVTFTWLGQVRVRPDRVYALAFTPERRMLLVTDQHWRPQCWLPGGGIEDGETAEQALARELLEEANARLESVVKIGSQRADEREGRCHYDAFYWCRITLAADFSPEYEITERHLVSPEDFLDRLFWGRSNPMAEMLLACALEIEESETGLTPRHP